MSGRRVLAGDVGGTNARLAIATVHPDGTVSLGPVARRAVAGFASLDDLVADWADEARAAGAVLPDDGVFALAGPGDAREVTLTNVRGWTVRADRLAARIGLKSVTLANDFAAQARAVPATPDTGLETLLPGTRLPEAPIVVLGPGTGLGQALVLPAAGGGWRVQATEGGHRSFAPVDARERAVLEVLAGELGHVSFEAVLSGPGLERLYRTLCRLDGASPRLASAGEIGPAAVAGDDPHAQAAAEMMVLILATFAGDAIVSTGATGGCVIAGGVAEALAPLIRAPAFAARLTAKGPMSHYFDGVPVQRARDGLAALTGAALMAPDR